MTRLSLGDIDEARSLLRDALRLHRISGCERLGAQDALSLAEVEFAAGETETAVQLGDEAAEFFRSHANWTQLATVLCNSSAYLVALGRYEEARVRAREALLLGQRTGMSRVIAWTLQHLASVAALRALNQERDLNEVRSSARLVGFVEALLRDVGITRERTEQQEYNKLLEALRVSLGESDVALLLNEGKMWDTARAIAEALEV
ncbi:MAG: hypothetical protein JO146_05465 [Candidatus Eremiobacteraeota bacterium]|nr:hypothetical protein [Candidatus Eremiobacteraeota bacterium]